ncbi:MAG: sugar ABC transporter permease [bacterium]|nr:sugar ABC transporter permease [bacterium]
MISTDTINLISTLIPAIIGAIYLAILFIQLNHSPILGAVIGAGAGAFGAMFFMVPLSYCTFEPTRKPIDVYFGVFLITIGTLASLGIARSASLFFFSGQPRSLIANQSSTGTFKGWLMPWLLLAPTLVILALFLYYPAIDTFRLSTLLARLGTSKTIFICVDNFTRLLQPENITIQTVLFVIIALQLLISSRSTFKDNDSTWAQIFRYSLIVTSTFFFFFVVLALLLTDSYYRVVITTFALSVAIVVFSLTMALGIATMAYQPIKGGNIYRTLLIWPYAISPPVAGIIFFIIFNNTGGIANNIIQLLGGEGFDWKDTTLAPLTIILASVWKALGFSILFYIAGLQNVPKDLLEAASIDGANAWQRFMRITIPMLSPITFFLIITNISYAFFDIFGTIDFLTGGSGGTSTMIYEIYNLGIRNNDLGKASAQSLVLFVLVIGITYLQFRTTGRRVSYGA